MFTGWSGSSKPGGVHVLALGGPRFAVSHGPPMATGRPRSATSVAAHQRVQEELEVVLLALVLGEEVQREALLPAPAPGEQAIGHVLDALVLDVVVRRAVEDRHLVRRHAEDRADLVRLQLAQLDELQRSWFTGGSSWILMPYSVSIGEKRLPPPNARLKPRASPSLRLVLEVPGCFSHMLGRASFAKKVAP
jgi:hypothetical protein